MRKFVSYLLRIFLQGLILLTPVGLTIYLLYSVFHALDTLIPFDLPRGIGFLIIIGTIMLVGTLDMGLKFMQIFFDWLDKVFSQMPFIKYIYTSIKDVTRSFVGSNKKFNKPVWLKTRNDPEEWRIGFLTQKDMTFLGLNDKVAVYLPHSYAISGWVVLVNAKDIRPVTEMTATEALKFAVSGGVTISDEQQKDDTKPLAQL